MKAIKKIALHSWREMNMAKNTKVAKPEENIWFDLAVGIYGTEIQGGDLYQENRTERALHWLATKKKVDVIAAKEIAAALWG
jgi:hypothetical protein